MVDQTDFDEAFNAQVACERSLDDVIRRLRDVGVKVKPEDRLIVNRWLEMFSEESPVPLGHRVAMLKGMLLRGE